ncbi:hypothetical protein DMB77_04090 [Staphylococcus saccharolyticus]|nr:hypothetical protein DMB74_04090 [Staphylococcus saccharolyticus]TAA94700.1 hypothetical protein DMB77_04090 [Staphylococcus saccharolyticus]
MANNVLNKKDGSNLDINVINGMTQALQDTKDKLNGNQRLKEVQTNAHKAIDNALIQQLEEINNANATDESKTEAIKEVEQDEKEAHLNIDKATSNQAVESSLRLFIASFKSKPLLTKFVISLMLSESSICCLIALS